MASEQPISKAKLWISYVVSALPVMLLLLSASFKFIQPPGFEEGLAHMGWNVTTTFYLGFVEIACVIVYLIPRTAVLGAILIAAYMGGAVATHVRVGDPFWIQVLVGVFVWFGLWLREPRVTALIPFRGK